MTDDVAALEVRRQLVALGRRRIERLLETTRRGGGVFTGDLMLAIGSRESGLRNIAGDAGHGRGVFQMDDRWQADWLRRVRGAPSGTWRAAIRGALRTGYVPLFVPALRRARKILAEDRRYLISVGVPSHLATHAAVAAYNAGPGAVATAWREGRSIDSPTTGGDYSEDVFARRAVVREWLRAEGLA